MLLLGDKHKDVAGLCKNCTCQDNCCEIYNPSFLKELDKLASKEYPIDFYTELFFQPLEINGILVIQSLESVMNDLQMYVNQMIR